MSSQDPIRNDPDSALSPAQLRVQALLRSTEAPAAREDFRIRLRQRFSSGDFEVGEDLRSSGAARPSPAPRSRWKLRYGVPLAAAAAVVLMFSLWNPGTTWEVMSVAANTAHVNLDGEEFSCDDLSLIQAALHPGCKIEVPEGGQIEILDQGKLVLQLNGSVAVTLPSLPFRWFGSTLESVFTGRGTLRVATAEQFAGTRYRLRSAGVDLEVTGTTFAVIQTEDETCICVLDGEVVATLPDGSKRSVSGGRRLTIRRASGQIEEGEMHPEERSQLRELRMRTDHIS